MEYQLKGDYFNGQYHVIPKTSTTGAHEEREGFSPANTNHKLWKLAIYYDHVEAVVQSAEKGFKLWREVPLEERIQYLKRYHKAVSAKKEDIARAISLEVGSTLR